MNKMLRTLTVFQPSGSRKEVILVLIPGIGPGCRVILPPSSCVAKLTTSPLLYTSSVPIAICVNTSIVSIRKLFLDWGEKKTTPEQGIVFHYLCIGITLGIFSHAIVVSQLQNSCLLFFVIPQHGNGVLQSAQNQKKNYAEGLFKKAQQWLKSSYPSS